MTHGVARAMGAGRRMRNLHGRIAVSEAAAWTARRFFGGRYDIVPNGVELPAAAPSVPVGAPGRLRIAFVGQAVERKGLPVLLRAFEGLREHVDAELVIVGAVPEEVEPLLLDDRGVTILGRVDDAEKTRVLREADVLCAPSLGGESFGMVLTEAFAQGTPVVASDIAGYRDVVRTGATASSCRAVTRSPWPRRCATWPLAPERPRRDGRRRGRARRATPGPVSPPRCSGSTSRRSRRVTARPTAGDPRRTRRPAPGDHARRRPGRRARPPDGDARARRPKAAERPACVARPAGRARARRDRWPRPDGWSPSSASGSTGSRQACCARARPGCSPRSRSCARRW